MKATMPPITIYHNGECSKSRGALEILQELNIPHNVRWYLADPLTRMDLETLLAQLKMQPSELVRRNEPLFAAHFSQREYSEAEWLDVLLQNPVLIERPVVESGDKAIIARPPERVLELVVPH